ncbi:MAG: hypothetical protein EHM19_09960 [Candidatus Latescibacterota bacterium]|nr:MAG: hypothetical protein EHM19_09960 [Candidatus Latescibacterota bacterium]
MKYSDDTAAKHVLGRLQAFADGELSPGEAERVRAHSAACPACARALAEIESVNAALNAYEETRLPPSIWPGLAERLERRRPFFWSVPFAVGASAAAAAGLLIGLWLGSAAGLGGGQAALAGETLRGDWSEVGSLLSGAGTTLDDLYLADASNGGETE